MGVLLCGSLHASAQHGAMNRSPIVLGVLHFFFSAGPPCRRRRKQKPHRSPGPLVARLVALIGPALCVVCVPYLC